MTQCLSRDRLFDWVQEYGSPLNLISTDPMSRNVLELQQVAEQFGIDFQVFFARKANKCLAFVDQANHDCIGIDTASENEVSQTLRCGMDAEKLICTAAIKSRSMIRLCVHSGVTIAVDNQDELRLVSDVAKQLGNVAKIAIRLGGFFHHEDKLFTRFGFDASAMELLDQIDREALQLVGFHFHLDGYDPSQRVSAIGQTLAWVDRAKELRFNPTFIDIGGGFPMSYLDHQDEWDSFWDQLQQAILGQREPITYRNHGLGLIAVDNCIHGSRQSYPYFQKPVRSEWFQQILQASIDERTVADALRQRHLQLRCEPGRSLLDGCGMTVAQVEFTKQNADGETLVGLSMNRTQCRTSSDDFLVDPIVVKKSKAESQVSQSGYFVGAYCTESELISLRKFVFPNGIRRGDLVAFPNTAGYLMHFLESRSHQFPLAKNLVVGDEVRLDAIEDLEMSAAQTK